jgi:manganese transport protein
VGIAITALDVLLVLLLQNSGFRLLEALVNALVATVGLCFLFELIVSRRPWTAVARGFIPTRPSCAPARCSTSPSASSAPR